MSSLATAQVTPPANDAAVDVVAAARLIAEQTASAHADEVDREGRFPAETIAAMRDQRLLGALIPTELGGLGAGIDQIAEATFVLGKQCASSAMIFAMHQLQVACLLNHAATGASRRFLEDVAARQLLLASATTEAGVGGKLRQSICAVERNGDNFSLDKQAGVISYGAYADAVLATARRTPESPDSDQVLVICAAPGLALTPTGDWNVMGLRGTCSPSFQLHGEGELEMVLDDPFAEVAARTMLPVSHLLWGFVWLGIAAAAESRARRYVQGKARKSPGVTPPAATRLAELTVVYQQLDALVHDALRHVTIRTDGLAGNEQSSGTGVAIASNSLKLAASAMVVEIVSRAIVICGMAAYREDTPFSLSRHLRDAHSAAVMVNNDRLTADNAQMLLIHREAK